MFMLNSFAGCVKADFNDSKCIVIAALAFETPKLTKMGWCFYSVGESSCVFSDSQVNSGTGANDDQSE